MASGSFYKQTAHGWYKYLVEWVSVPNTAENYSDVTFTHKFVAQYSASIGSRTGNPYTANGSSGTWSAASVSGSGTKTLGTTTIRINHNSDGTKSFSASFTYRSLANIDDLSTSDTMTASGTVTLDNIARASSFVLSGNITAGNPVTVTITRADNSYYHRVTFSIGSYSYVANNVATSLTYTIPVEWCNAINSSVTGVVTVTVVTYNSGGTALGTASAPLTVTVPASIVPTISAVGLVRNDGAVPAAWNVYVKGKSRVTVNVTAAGAYGSTIISYRITGGGYTLNANGAMTDYLALSGSITFEATVTDSRGRTAVMSSAAITVYDYEAPKIQSAEAFRCTSAGVEDDLGTYVSVKMTYSISLVNGKNTVAAASAYRRTAESAEAWVLLGNVSGTAVKYSGLSASVEYEIRFLLRDYFTEITEIQNLSGKTVDDIYPGGTGYAIGGYAEDGKFISHMPAQMKSGLDVVGNLTVSGNALKACCATGSAETLSLTAGAVTQITLATLNAFHDNTVFSISSGGVKVATAGNYLVSGSIYIALPNTVNTAISRGVYIFNGATEINSGMEYGYNTNGMAAISCGAKVVSLAANDILYLKARSIGTSGTAYPSNTSTYLTLIKI